MPAYSAGKIYVIRTRATDDRVVYVGSTTQTLCERMADHRRAANAGRNTKLYKMMRDVGVEHFHVELLADFSCERREQLLAEEGKHIRALRPECNVRIEGRTQKEYKREWRDANPGVDAARMKAWREANPGVKAAREKAYRDANPGVDAARCKAYREANTGVTAARCKAYRERKKAVTAGVAAAAIV